MITLALREKTILAFMAAFLFLSIFFFVPAGTFDYWQAWVYIAILIIPVAFVMVYFLKNDPEFLERRFRTKEKEARQAAIIKFSIIVFLIAFLFPGLDKRFGWSYVQTEVVLIADLLVFLSYMLIFLVFRENSHAGRTVIVEKGQKVISTGPYSVVRHPMYLGVLVMYLATPVALGSYVSLIPFLFIVPVLVLRILNEEEVLRRDLLGYNIYCEKIKYRLLPFVW
ncbi:isoprenylcysteine carboxylmethyltransferase family protein [Candidatus Micrarchaeota archaeon]|nr:isoprenylcysteine carboxylmethyltransferase family protein [Candidatus Micrarchaeota archaeon]MBU1166388.1 isoprenylcysteine carboxylmethyltransferase family protein [Candidatus Micrarchaeota archaeon]MBU1887180.1 isoprenylcysteine carboxylmethyltransferase family protein [Candidatus Micrarchaeota archaeon]